MESRPYDRYQHPQFEAVPLHEAANLEDMHAPAITDTSVPGETNEITEIYQASQTGRRDQIILERRLKEASAILKTHGIDPSEDFTPAGFDGFLVTADDGLIRYKDDITDRAAQRIVADLRAYFTPEGESDPLSDAYMARLEDEILSWGMYDWYRPPATPVSFRPVVSTDEQGLFSGHNIKLMLHEDNFDLRILPGDPASRSSEYTDRLAALAGREVLYGDPVEVRLWKEMPVYLGPTEASCSLPVDTALEQFNRILGFSPDKVERFTEMGVRENIAGNSVSRIGVTYADERTHMRISVENMPRAYRTSENGKRLEGYHYIEETIDGFELPIPHLVLSLYGAHGSRGFSPTIKALLATNFARRDPTTKPPQKTLYTPATIKRYNV